VTDKTPDKTNRGRKKVGKKMVGLYMTPEEVMRLDAVAERNFRTRSGQALCFILNGMKADENTELLATLRDVTHVLERFADGEATIDPTVCITDCRAAIAKAERGEA
jgi:hypothetical protein